ncbi:hypothetical protein CIG75_09695 [Tumebacillus algifaecis]|uniref:Uncharacterized protein n=1 Tax=Tumebacillus algifaecis TaxID=1214604 RepID=A0A223D1I2_9BACL|nr:hypothetical protein [Tumebacillus algifaecis]ASS75227.1 hypothetical protein CIG75_09695 [Tumebacillus algifaecis]
MKSTERNPQVLDAYYRAHEGIVKDLSHYYQSKSKEELWLIRAELTRRRHVLGNIPLLASTTPIVFLIFGTQVNKYFPHDSLRWMIVAVSSILIIVWSINHHFRQKGRVHLDLWLIEEIMKERFQNAGRAVQLEEEGTGAWPHPEIERVERIEHKH